MDQIKVLHQQEVNIINDENVINSSKIKSLEYDLESKEKEYKKLKLLADKNTSNVEELQEKEKQIAEQNKYFAQIKLNLEESAKKLKNRLIEAQEENLKRLKNFEISKKEKEEELENKFNKISSENRGMVSKNYEKELDIKNRFNLLVGEKEISNQKTKMYNANFDDETAKLKQLQQT